MISAWTLLAAVAPLIGANIYSLRVIRGLRDALKMREALLGDEHPRWAIIHAGGTMVLTLEQAVRRVRITSRGFAEIKVETE